MAFTEVDGLTLPDVLDTDLMSAKAVLITDDFKDKTVGDIRDAIKVETIRDGRDGLPTPPTVDNLSEIWYDGRGNLYSVEESFTAATLARGTWSQYTNSNYDGEHGNNYHGTNSHYYYNIANHGFYQITLHPGGTYYDAFYSYARVTVDTALGSTAIWLGEHATERDAVNSIIGYSNSATYYAYFDDHVRVLDNSTYVAPVTQTSVFDWVRTGGSHTQIVQVRNRPPSHDDVIVNMNGIFIDKLNGNTYFSIGGGDWRFMGSQHSPRDQVFVSDFTTHTGSGAATTVPVGEYYAFEDSVNFGVEPGSDLDEILGSIEVDDILYVGTEKFNLTGSGRTVIDTTRVVHYFNGTWDNDFDNDIVFGTEESIYYDHPHVFVYETIWSGTIGQGSANQTLNVGKKFSDYEMLMFKVNRYGPSKTTIPQSDFGSVQLTAGSRNITLDWVSDTQWNTESGSTGINVKEIKGIKRR